MQRKKNGIIKSLNKKKKQKKWKTKIATKKRNTQKTTKWILIQVHECDS